MKNIKDISIRGFLQERGINPVKYYSNYGLYYSPYREDNNASFKVDYDKNLWIDYGTGEGGSIIDLVMKMENCSFHETANRLERNPANVHLGSNADRPFSFHSENPSMLIQNIIPINHPKLVACVRERGIDLTLANFYCIEIHYQNSGGNHISIGFRNDKGGYELSSPPNFKGCFPPKEITTYRNGKESCLVFEGFWDFLSYLTIQKVEKTKHDVAVLNSVANVQKAINFLKSHKEIYTYLDNDDAGRKATEYIQSVNSTVYNRSISYAEYKDLNDYLRGKKLAVKPKVIKKKSGIKI